MQSVFRNFIHVTCRYNDAIVESYCLICHRFVSASTSERNVMLSEKVHRKACLERNRALPQYANLEDARASR